MYGSTSASIDESAVEHVPEGNSTTRFLSKNRSLAALVAIIGLTIGALILVVANESNSVMSLTMVATKHGKPGHEGKQIEGMNRPDEVIIIESDGAYPDFKLYSSAFSYNETLPDEFSCLGSDGGHNPPFYWEGVPDETQSFAFVFHSKNHWDWGLFNIPANQTTIGENCSYPDQRDFYNCGGAAVGSYPDKAKYYYDPPCSEGPGSKTYYWVVFALSDYLQPDEVSDSGDDAGHFDYKYAGFNIHDLMLMIENITIATSTVVTPFTHYSD